MIDKSSKVISDKHLKHKVDAIDKKNGGWNPEAKKTEPIGDSDEMAEQIGAAPGLCGCKDYMGGDKM